MDIGAILGLWPVRAVIGFLAIVTLLIGGALILVYTERKIAGFIQDRLGPVHNGPWGLLQTVADAGKLLLKEDVVPSNVDRWMYMLAPIVFFMPVAAVYVVVPFATGLQVADLNVGLLYIFAVSSFGVLGVIMAGWGSNNKYSLLGGLRGAAQMVSYELPMILSLVTIVLMAGALSLQQIVGAQTSAVPFILVQPLAFLIYFTCALAETNRNPFDLPEAESELVAGYLTEYSGMRWAIYFLGEYGNMAGVSAVATVAFLGGGWLPFVSLAGPVGMIVSAVVFIAKVYFLIFVMQWIRGTLPRLRADQLMAYCWKVLVPATLINIFVTSFIVIFFPTAYLVPVAVLNWIMLLVFIAALPRLVGSTVRPRVQVSSMSEALAGGKV
jgi:NADH-quinone oxidoreductase subunit H